MKSAGAVGGLVNVGGDIVAFGKRADGQTWTIGVKHPFDSNALVGRLRVEDRAVATSGLQQRFVEIDGRRYSHIVDPRSGRPVDEAPCVTVIAPDGLTADAWATVFSVLSPAEGKKLIDGGGVDAGVEVMWISGDADEPKFEQTAGFGAFLIGS
jgi:thiamine biosynthesis lipoprotein